MLHQIVLIHLEDEASVVVLNGILTYHEDTDRNAFNEYCTATSVAHRLQLALKQHQFKEFTLKYSDVPEDWNFDDIVRVAREKFLTQKAIVKVPACWRKLIDVVFPDNLEGITSEKDQKGNADPEPHYDDTRRIEGRFPNNEHFSLMLCSGQGNYWGGWSIGEVESEPLESWPEPVETEIDGVAYVLAIEWV